MPKPKIKESDYNSSNFAFAFLGKSFTKYLVSVILLTCFILISFIITESFLGLDLMKLFFQYPGTGFNIEITAYILTFPIILIFSRRLFFKMIEVRDFFLGKEICTAHGKNNCLACSRIEEPKGNNKEFDEYRTSINKWMQRAYGKGWISIAIILLFIAICSFLIPNLITGDLSLKWWIVLDLFIRMPLFFAITITIINCLITDIITFKMTKWKIRTSILHPDRVGGLKPIGDLAFRNLITYAVIIALTMVGISILYVYKTPTHEASLLNLILTIIGFVASTLIILGVSLYFIHSKCNAFKDEELEKLCLRFDNNYKKFQENMQDPRLIQILLLDSSLNDQVEQLKTWPWNSGLIWKAFIAIFAPLIIQFVIGGLNSI